MAIQASLIKWYQCATWNEGDSHGGDIDTGNEITSGVDQNIFDDVTNDERVAGDTDYRKIYIRNENADSWNSVKCWISQFTDSADDEISVLNAGTKSTAGNVVQCTGTATFTNGSPTVTTSVDLSDELAVGEMIYNSTDDTESAAVAIASISGTTITLASNYGGTGGATKNINVAGIDQVAGGDWKSPNAKGHADVLDFGTLAQNEYAGIWIRRVVNAAADGYTDNTFKIAAESS